VTTGLILPPNFDAGMTLTGPAFDRVGTYVFGTTVDLSPPLPATGTFCCAAGVHRP
jgi:hypothetical protein